MRPATRAKSAAAVTSSTKTADHRHGSLRRHVGNDWSDDADRVGHEWHGVYGDSRVWRASLSAASRRRSLTPAPRSRSPARTSILSSATTRVTLNQAFATLTTAAPTSIPTAVPAVATSGKIVVATPTGPRPARTICLSHHRAFRPPTCSFTGRMLFGEANALTVPMTTASKIGLVLFDGSLSQRIALKVSGITIRAARSTILKPVQDRAHPRSGFHLRR